MLKIEQINKLQSDLTILLARLECRQVQFIEYGDPTEPPSLQTGHLRIYYTMTAAGMQFSVKMIVNNTEGSAQYFPSLEATRDYAMNRVMHYHSAKPHFDFCAISTREKLAEIMAEWPGDPVSSIPK